MRLGYHLFIELYSSGTIILTGHDNGILAVLRVVDVETNALSGASAPATTAAVADISADAQKIEKKEAIVKKETKETAKEDGKKEKWKSTSVSDSDTLWSISCVHSMG
ncbi:hypothetical protein BCR33DRAFT_231997 [Rhizoclosmatium globosum]|uniref:Uncharacterized protein n=1 Tax=Rhizoclosmatium globosum TaxID=329046 RepID=A0A1Y2CAR3_9FUNG|nr:hypothetical protein BCR33DRAFT_231997 [Rhizoclosmatium globosum]|eukprot:ORY43944.1 hypothetical protein BCR33DRAFT_231997 [Rhizoclosmatium globosum]